MLVELPYTHKLRNEPVLGGSIPRGSLVVSVRQGSAVPFKSPLYSTPPGSRGPFFQSRAFNVIFVSA